MTHRCCSIVELRQYTLHPGRRDGLIDLFERRFIEGQEAAGIRVLGQFRDVDDPDRFVWLRGFPDMEARRQSLGAFYGGPEWKAHRDEANAAMIDSNDVLLLRPASGSSSFALHDVRAPIGTADRPGRLEVATIYSLSALVEDFVGFFEGNVRPLMAETGSSPIATFRTEPAENTFPQLPVRTGESVFVWFAEFDTAECHSEHIGRLASSMSWWDDVLPELFRRLRAAPRHLRLLPTGRSLLGHRPVGV